MRNVEPEHLRPPLDLRLPKSRRRRPLVLAVSVGVHVLLFLFGALEPWVPQLRYRPSPLASAVDTIPLVFLEPPPLKRVPAPPEVPRQLVRKKADAPFVTPEPERLPPPEVPVDTTTTRPPVSELVPTPAPGPVREPIGRIGPELGDGRLWVQPLPLPPKELARRLSRSHVALVDSAVTSIVQSYLDSIAGDPASRGTPLPDWTTDIAGKKFGLDSNNIYVAGLKIPAAVLALLPIPAGNIDQNHAYNRMLELRADIQQAARRADNLAEFKQRIREIRLRKEREEEFERSAHQTPSKEPEEKPEPPASRDSSAAADKNAGERER